MSTAETDGINPTYDEQSGYDTSDSRYPPDWKPRAKAIRKRDDYTCQDCGIKSGPHTAYGEGKVLDVHHITFLEHGGSNRFDNLTTLCVDCHNDRHDHDITEHRDGYEPTAAAPGMEDRLRQLVRYCLGGVGVLLLHVAALSVLLTEPVGTLLWYAGGGYVGLLVVTLLVRPRSIAALYGLAGSMGVAIMQVASISEIGGVSTTTLVLTTFVPVLLAGVWWWDQR